MNKLRLLNRLERKRTFNQFTQGKKKKAFGILIYLLSLWGYFWIGGLLPIFASMAILDSKGEAGAFSVSVVLNDAGTLSSMDVMALAFLLASAIIAFIQIRNIYFNDFDQSTLWSLPVDTRLILISKNTGPAVFSLPLVLAFTLPSMILTYVATGSLIKAILVLVVFFCANQLGECLGCFLRIFSAKGGSRLQLSKGVKSFFGFLLFVVFMVGFYTELARDFKDLVVFMGFYNRLPAAARPVSFALNHHLWLILVFVLLTGIIYYAFLNYMAKHFFTIGESLAPRGTVKAVKGGDYKVRRKYAALIRKERQLFFSNSAVAFNSFFGTVLPVILAAILFVPAVKEMFLGFLESQSFVSPDAAIFLILIGLAGMMNLAGFGFSLEGASAYNTYTLPLKGQSVFLGKLFMAASLIAPAYIIAWLLLIINLRPDLVYWPFYLFGPLAYALFINGISLFFDWKFANYDWTNPQELAKNSKQSFFSGLGSLLVSFAILLIGVGVMTKAPLVYAALLTLIFVAGNIILYFLTRDITVYHQ
ncbi:hypothetical protein AAA081_05930 [Aedoeadaptatus acetigenes]|uniref:ABC-2 type transport system permease protein n=1 Tax=Aedoeadaptatus acetigenes TaxID=2981723 RepID=A0ABV1J6L8_9FIRM